VTPRLIENLRFGTEVLVLAILIYAFIRFLQETRGSAVLKGFVVVVIGVVVGFVLLVQTLDLTRLRWLAERGFGALVFALIVVFQAEIRQALVSLGESPWIRRFVGRGRATRVDAIVEAAFALSLRGAGAIIVVERGDGLAAMAESGVRVDAELSAPLLLTIFQKDTPLHDGAVLVRGDRIVAAGCLLPLSDNPNVAQALGTRHRAAMGATEESDALAVVVSEETRRVSVARRGALELGVTPARLREIVAGPVEDAPEETPAAEAAA
jgi:diadenylate cyclase